MDDNTANQREEDALNNRKQGTMEEENSKEVDLGQVMQSADMLIQQAIDSGQTINPQQILSQSGIHTALSDAQLNELNLRLDQIMRNRGQGNGTAMARDRQEGAPEVGPAEPRRDDEKITVKDVDDLEALDATPVIGAAAPAGSKDRTPDM